MKFALKKVPGLVWLVHGSRGLVQHLCVCFLRNFLSFATGKPMRRGLLFDSLPGRFALAEHARESYLVCISDRVIGRILYARGDFDFAKFEKAYQILCDKNIISVEKALPTLFDVGANIGSICLPALARNMVRDCLAFEPDAENFRLLQINALLNGVEDGITLHLAAVGQQAGSVSVLRSQTNFGDHRVRQSLGSSVDSVPMVTLDTFADSIDLDNTILWMDVQGFEGFVIAGAARFCVQGVPLVLEYCKADLVAAGCYDLLIEKLLAAKYTMFYDLNEGRAKPQPLTQAAMYGLADRLDADNTFTDLLFLPEV